MLGQLSQRSIRALAEMLRSYKPQKRQQYLPELRNRRPAIIGGGGGAIIEFGFVVGFLLSDAELGYRDGDVLIAPAIAPENPLDDEEEDPIPEHRYVAHTLRYATSPGVTEWPDRRPFIPLHTKVPLAKMGPRNEWYVALGFMGTREC